MINKVKKNALRTEVCMVSERESPSLGSITKHFFPRTYKITNND